MTVDAQSLKEKILEIYPELGANKLNLSVAFDTEKTCWLVSMEKDGNSMSTHLERKDAIDCLEGMKCIYLGNQISEFIATYCQGVDKC